MNNDNPAPSQHDSQALLNQVILDYMREQKHKRRWRWFFRSLIVLLVLVIYVKISLMDDQSNLTSLKAHVGLIDINGTIMDGQSASAENFAKGLKNAYDNKNMKALILRINSPGGSPVQADYMYNALSHYQKAYPDVKTYAVCVDLCASAAYYVAVGADEIYASPASLVGSIGVLFNGFGFVDSMDKLGISRRLITAGSNKAFLDPFSPEKPEDKQRMSAMLDLIHQQFIAKVKEGRKGRLHIDDDTFSGLFWTGEQSLSRGLIDGFASSGELMRDKIKLAEVVDYTYKPNLFDRFAKTMGTAMADQLPLALGVHQGIQ